MTTDPFDQLRDRGGADPSAQPSERFVARLRGQIIAALAADVPFIDLPERKAAMATTETPTSAADPSTAAPTVLVPYLSVSGAADAISWYSDVLGAREVLRYDADDGRVGHAELDFGGGAILHLADEYPELGFVSPTTIGATAGGLSLRVTDVDTVYANALARGAEGQRAPEDQPYGDRSASIVDPFGHRWTLQTPIKTPSVDDIDASMEGFTVRTAATEPTAPTSTSGAEREAPNQPPVELGYFTMTAPDTARAIQFFGALFGWQPEEGNMGEGYAHIANTELPLGFAPGAATDAPELYFRVVELAPYVERVRELGGRVEAERTYASGLSADCRDDQGRRFQLWQPAPGY